MIDQDKKIRTIFKLLFQWAAPMWVPERCYRGCEKLKPWILTASIILLTLGIVQALWLAPPDYQQGDAYRIIYIHVPFAMLSLMCYAVMGTLSLIFLIWRIKLADTMAYSLASIGAIMTALALITGAIWGKPMWGAWWVWDARLTSELILLFLYLAYIALYDAIKTQQPKSIAPAVLAVVGLVDLPIIHYSVNWWQTLHQGATIARFGKPALDASMLYPLLMMLVGTLMFVIYLTIIKLQTELLKNHAMKIQINT